MTDNRGGTLAWDGKPPARARRPSLADQVISTGRQQVASHTSISCDHPTARCAGIVVVPLETGRRDVGTLPALTTSTPVRCCCGPRRGRAVRSSQLSWPSSRVARPAQRAEVRALRAQISPHFVYNRYHIASFIRTDRCGPVSC